MMKVPRRLYSRARLTFYLTQEKAPEAEVDLFLEGWAQRGLTTILAIRGVRGMLGGGIGLLPGKEIEIKGMAAEGCQEEEVDLEILIGLGGVGLDRGVDLEVGAGLVDIVDQGGEVEVMIVGEVLIKVK